MLDILAQQNRELARLARDSDPVLAPLAREHETFADFIVQANATGEASAERARRHRARHRAAARLPARAAPADGRPRQGRGPGHAAAARPRRGRTGARPPDQGAGHLLRRARESLPEPRRRARARPARPDRGAAADPEARRARHASWRPSRSTSTSSPRASKDTAGIQRINDFLYYLTLATNGYDRLGHYLRAGLVTNLLLDLHGGGVGHLLGHFFNTRTSRAARRPLRLRPATRRRPAAAVAEAWPRPACSAAPRPERNRGAGARAPAEPRPARAGQERRRRRSGAEEPVLDYLLGARTNEPAPLARRADREPGAGGSGDRAGHDRRRLPLLQREHRSAVRARPTT